MAIKRPRGRERRVRGERTIRIKVSFAQSEVEQLKAVAALNQYASVSEFVRDAVNDAADDCGAVRPCVGRRSGERRQRTAAVPSERRQGDRRRSGMIS